MPFSPEEIEEKDFLITLRGYDKDEVRAFLSALASDYRNLLDVSQPTGGGNPFEALGSELAGVLQTAKETADRMKRSAREEADALRRKAQEEAGRLTQDAQEALSQARAEAEAHVRKVTEEADRKAIEVRGSAEREATEKLVAAEGRVQKLIGLEEKIRGRLNTLEKVLASVREDMAVDDSDYADVLPAKSQEADKDTESAEADAQSESKAANNGGLGEKSDQQALSEDLSGYRPSNS